jgi:hypothetical protein
MTLEIPIKHGWLFELVGVYISDVCIRLGHARYRLDSDGWPVLTDEERQRIHAEAIGPDAGILSELEALRQELDAQVPSPRELVSLAIRLGRWESGQLMAEVEARRARQEGDKDRTRLACLKLSRQIDRHNRAVELKMARHEQEPGVPDHPGKEEFHRRLAEATGRSVNTVRAHLEGFYEPPGAGEWEIFPGPET